MTLPQEVWLRGPVEGILPVLQPAAHAMIQAGEDVVVAVSDLSPAQRWARPAGVASLGFHIAHLPGRLDRLLTYSRGASLSDGQLAVLAAERTVHDDRPALDRLLNGLAAGLDAAVAYLRTVPSEAILLPREVGRKRMPSSTIGLIFHAAEHSSRHAGQVVTLARIVIGEQPQ